MAIKRTHEEYVALLKEIHPLVEVCDTYINARTPILHRCLKDGCGYQWHGVPDGVLHSKYGCPKCANAVIKEHDVYVSQVKIKRPELRVIEQYKGSKIAILHYCEKCENELMMKPCNVLDSHLCPICAKQMIGPAPKYTNSIWASPYKEIALLYMTEQQTKELTPFSSKKASVTCPDCGKKKAMSPNHLFTEGFSCVCKDGISFPNKFMYCLVDQLCLQFEPEYRPEWANEYRYDIFIPAYNLIIENHGMQHYKESTGNFGKKTTLQQQLERDAEKRTLAIQNGITHYIEVDCRISSMDYLKKSIMASRLPSTLCFGTDDIDWVACAINGLKNVVKECAELWNSGFGAKQIAPMLKIDRSLVSQYLNKAAKVGWCEYSKALAMKRKGEQSKGLNHWNATPVYCIEMDKIFVTVQEAKFAVDPAHGKAHIAAACDGTYQKTKGYSFRYIEDQVKDDGEVIKGAITLGLITRKRYENFLNSLLDK